MPPLQSSRIVDQLRERIRYLHYSLRTEEAYVYWVKGFIRFHQLRHPAEMGKAEIEAYLTWLVAQRNVSSSTHRQALSALLFLYGKVLDVELPWLETIGRPREAKRLPVTLSPDEVGRIFLHMDGEFLLLAQLLYGTGLRILEAMRLRVKDLDFTRNTIIVREAKGNKDRAVMMPAKLVEALQSQLQRANTLWAKDRAAARPGVYMPDALDRKYPRAGQTWAWHWVFPQSSLAVDPRTGIERRHHVYETTFQRAFKRAVEAAQIHKPATPHTLRHTFATQVLQSGYDIRTVQELLGHADVKTTMIYTHVLKVGGGGVISPFDRL
jgi:integron integrase